MKWTYRCDNVLRFFVWPVIGFCHFLLNLSWKYAHYRNGTFPEPFTMGDKTFPPRLFFKEQSFWWCVKSAWKQRYEE